MYKNHMRVITRLEHCEESYWQFTMCFAHGELCLCLGSSLFDHSLMGSFKFLFDHKYIFKTV